MFTANVRLLALLSAIALSSTARAERPLESRILGFLAAHCAGSAQRPLPSCTVTDLDGDQRLDAALAAPAGWNTGTRALTIRLASGNGDLVLDLARWPTASSFVARDVDGDDDRDLVITSGTRQPVAVFLNDGHGGFVFDPEGSYLAAADADFGQELEGNQPDGGALSCLQGRNSGSVSENDHRTGTTRLLTVDRLCAARPALARRVFSLGSGLIRAP